SLRSPRARHHAALRSSCSVLVARQASHRSYRVCCWCAASDPLCSCRRSARDGSRDQNGSDEIPKRRNGANGEKKRRVGGREDATSSLAASRAIARRQLCFVSV